MRELNLQWSDFHVIIINTHVTHFSEIDKFYFIMLNGKTNLQNTFKHVIHKAYT